jgi:catecholate siderophore receptor
LHLGWTGDELKSSSNAGIRSFARKALTPAAFAGIAGLALTPHAAMAADDADAPVVESVTVTAQKPGEPVSEKLTATLLETPKSIQVIPQALIRSTSATTLSDLMRTVPGLTLGSGEGGTSMGDRPFIRGVESTNDVFVDGVRDAGVQSREVFNLEQVEVTKGPGSVFSGRGSTGGSVNLVSKMPKVGSFQAGTLALGTDDARRATVDINQQLTPGVAVRLNAMTHEADVAGRDAVSVSRWGVAPSVALGLDGPLRAILSYYHLETDDVPDYGIPYDPATLRPIKGHDEDFYGVLSRDFHVTESDIGTLRLEYDLAPNLRLTNTTRYGVSSNAYVVTNPDDSRGNVRNGYLFRSSKNRNVETTTLANVTNLAGAFEFGGLEHSFSAGLELSEEKTHNQGYYVTGPGLGQQPGFPPVAAATRVDQAFSATNLGCSSPTRLGAAFGYNCTTLDNPNPNDPWIGSVTRAIAYNDNTTQVAALYLFDTIALSDQWSVNLGLRYDDFRTKLSGITAAVTPTAPYYTTTRVSLSNKSDFLSYQLGVVYQPRPNGSIYASVGTSSNPSGEGTGDFSSLSLANANLDPEENISYELGTKWELFGGRLLATGALFRTEKTNARVTDSLGHILLVGEQRVNGVELSANGAISERWSLFGGYTWLDSEIVDGGPLNTNEGKTFPNTPEHSLTAWTTYAVTPAISLGGGAVYMSSRFADPANLRKVDSYWRFDAVGTWRVNRNVTLQLNVNNITNERYVERPFQTHMVQIAAGRSALLTANLEF